MLEHLGEPKAAQAVAGALDVMRAGPDVHTPDLGGRANTRELGEAIAREIAVAAQL